MQKIPTELIEKALAFTGKTMEYVREDVYCGLGYEGPDIRKGFSIEKFCYYLLSPEFIEQFHDRQYHEKFWIIDDYSQSSRKFGESIYEYQKGNSQPIIELLYKI